MILISLLLLSISINIALYYQQNARNPLDFIGLNRRKMDLLSEKEHERIANHALSKAEEFAALTGQGDKGWLQLMKAWDYVKDPFLAENIALNYNNLEGYGSIAVSEFISANVTKKDMKDLINDYNKHAEILSKSKSLWQSSSMDPGKSCTTLAFATAFNTWHLSKQGIFKNITKLNEEIYHTSVKEYEKIKKLNPYMNATELNHALWKKQKESLDKTNSFWGSFAHIEEFENLVFAMRKGANRFLGETHGIPKRDAENKASHPLVVWVSVHLENSVHQPHVTSDALVGGVYYVKVPKGSGNLQLYDPRGKSPLGLEDPISEPLPPFHRTIGIQPRDGLMVLFPGWLVHSVLKSRNIPNEVGYRVSISLNLKGEWQDTAFLNVASSGCSYDD